MTTDFSFTAWNHCTPDIDDKPTLLSTSLESHNTSRISIRKAFCLSFYGTKPYSKITLFSTNDKHEKCKKCLHFINLKCMNVISQIQNSHFFLQNASSRLRSHFYFLIHIHAFGVQVASKTVWYTNEAHDIFFSDTHLGISCRICCFFFSSVPRCQTISI